MKLGGFIMRPFNRTVEKVLAWIANVLLIILTGYLTYGAFFQLDLVKNNPELIKQVREILARDPQVAIYSPEQFINLIVVAFKVYAVIYIILAILAVLATLLMGKRILSGIFFLLVAIAVGVLLSEYYYLCTYCILSLQLCCLLEKNHQQSFQNNKNNKKQ